MNLAIKTAAGEWSSGAVAVTRWVSFCIAIWLCFLIPQVRKLTKLVLPNQKDAWRLIVIGFLLVGPAHALYYAALKTAGTGESTVINTTGPLWTTLFAIAILKEKVTGWRWTAIILGACGAYIVAAGFSMPRFSDGNTAANLLYLSGTLMECLAFVCAAALLRKSSGIGALAYEITGAAAAQIALPFLFPGMISLKFGLLSPPAVIAILYLIFIAGLVCFGGWYIVAESAPVSLMLISLGMQAPIASFLGWYFLGEKIGSQMAIGAIIIVLALAIAIWDTKRIANAEELTNELDKDTFPGSVGPA